MKNVTDHFSKVPQAVFAHIFQYFDFTELNSISLVCKKFYNFIHSEAFSKMYFPYQERQHLTRCLERCNSNFSHYLQSQIKLITNLHLFRYRTQSIATHFYPSKDGYVVYTDKNKKIEIFNSLLNKKILIENGFLLTILKILRNELLTEHIENQVPFLTIWDIHTGKEIFKTSYAPITLYYSHALVFFMNLEKKYYAFHVETHSVYKVDVNKEEKEVLLNHENLPSTKIKCSGDTLLCMYHSFEGKINIFSLKAGEKSIHRMTISAKSSFNWFSICDDMIFFVPEVGQYISFYNFKTGEFLINLDLEVSGQISRDYFFKTQKILLIEMKDTINVIDLNEKTIKYTLPFGITDYIAKGDHLLTKSLQSIDLFTIKTGKLLDSFNSNQTHVKHALIEDYFFFFQEKSDIFYICNLKKSLPLTNSKKYPIPKNLLAHAVHFIGMIKEYVFIGLDCSPSEPLSKIHIINMLTASTKILTINRWITEDEVRGITESSVYATITASALMLRGYSDRRTSYTQILHFSHLFDTAYPTSDSFSFIQK